MNFDSILQLESEADKAVFILGLVTLLRDDQITIEDAEHAAFSPRVVDIIRSKQGISKLLETTLYLGAELEDIEDDDHDEFNRILDQLRNRAYKIIELS